MSTFQYKSGLGNSASYQVSSIPYLLKGSTSNDTIIEIAFPNVTNFIEIFTAAGSPDLRIGFSSLGIRKSPSPVGTNYILHSAGTSDIYDWRVASLFLLRNPSGGSGGTVNYEIRAGLTTVDSAELSNNWSGSAGVG